MKSTFRNINESKFSLRITYLYKNTIKINVNTVFQVNDVNRVCLINDEAIATFDELTLGLGQRKPKLGTLVDLVQETFGEVRGSSSASYNKNHTSKVSSSVALYQFKFLSFPKIMNSPKRQAISRMAKYLLLCPPAPSRFKWSRSSSHLYFRDF